MKCLHICNDLVGSKVHENLYLSFENMGIEQEIFCPIRSYTKSYVPKIRETLNSRVVTSDEIASYHRVLFRKKIAFLHKSLVEQVNLSEIDIVHATTFFSDGAIALKLFKEYKIPYVVALRGTDTNLFLKYRIDLYPLAKQIIKNASRLIFISTSLEQNFSKHWFIKKLEPKFNIKKKSITIYNGLDSNWLNNPAHKKDINPTKILYIGKFNKNKNVVSLIKAFLILKVKYSNLQLNLIGKGGAQEEEIIKYSKEYKGSINYFGPIYNKEELQKMYRSNHIFAMTSIGETFGLVYVEALTQGLPILYTKNQGIDGAFKENVGEAINANSINSIAIGLGKLINNYGEYNLDQIDFSKFSWEDIASTYFELYKTVINENS